MRELSNDVRGNREDNLLDEKHVSMSDRFEDFERRYQDLRSVWNFFDQLHNDPMLRVKVLARLEIVDRVTLEIEGVVGSRLPMLPDEDDMPF